MPLLAATSFSFGDALLTVIELAFMFLWIWIAVGVVFDIFRSPDLSNFSKALWVLAIFVFPLLGVLAYVIIRGHTMHTHEAQDRARYMAFRGYGPGRSSSSPSDDIDQLAGLHARGVLTTEEFERAKEKVLQ
jgi:hypothetical protein